MSAFLVIEPDTLPSICNDLAAVEPVFGRILEQYGQPPFWQRAQSFETLAQIIIEQQVSLASALSVWKRLLAGLGEVTPETVLAAGDGRLRSLSVTRQKSRYLLELARAVRSGQLNLDDLHENPDRHVHAKLTAITGIGDWTATVYLMEALNRSDCFPLGDVALVNSMKHEFDLPRETGKDYLLARSEPWAPWRTAASFLLWHAYIQRKGIVYPWAESE